MIRFALSVLFTPATFILLVVTGISPMYFRWLGLTKHSTLPPVEYLPFFILPAIGAWLGWKGYLELRNR